ncbi:hypothetical protein CGSMWGv00703C2mash_03666, partial [Gardnerella pickettii 00703C2mash]
MSAGFEYVNKRLFIVYDSRDVFALIENQPWNILNFVNVKNKFILFFEKILDKRIEREHA